MGGDGTSRTTLPVERQSSTLLRFDPTAPDEPAPDTVIVVLDTTWTPSPTARPEDRCISLRDVAKRVMAGRDLSAECAALLDAWAEEAGVVDALVVEGVSFWHGERLRYARWLVEQALWLAIVEDLVAAERPAAIACSSGSDPGLVGAVRAVAARDGIDLLVTPPERTTQPAPIRKAEPSAAPAPRVERGRRGIPLITRTQRYWSVQQRRRRVVARRIRRIRHSRLRPLLVVQAHARQRIDTPDGPRFLNPFLGPVVERLVGSALDPVEVDIRGRLDDDATWQRIRGRRGCRRLPVDALTLAGPPVSMKSARRRAKVVADLIGAVQAPLVVAGIDLGPDLARLISSKVRSRFARSVAGVAQIRQLLREIRPVGVLIADEYHRQDWLAAAGAEGVPTAAIQHGVIHPWHYGYMYRTRPASLRLPDRTFVFGEWERDLLTVQSVYRADEVTVGGSPRLDLVQRDTVDPRAVRRELGIADGDRLVVLSGTWGALDRRFHYPIALAHLFCRPIQRIHLVVKLHPSERDEGPYRQVIAGLAAAHGFTPPPITVVPSESIDLYRLLAAADAHLGIRSTVLTEAVFTGTPNLLADVLEGSDLLGYVNAGAAVAVRTPEDVAMALDRPRDSEGSRRLAFLRAHFEPGSATERIASDLSAWFSN